MPSSGPRPGRGLLGACVSTPSATRPRVRVVYPCARPTAAAVDASTAAGATSQPRQVARPFVPSTAAGGAANFQVVQERRGRVAVHYALLTAAANAASKSAAASRHAPAAPTIARATVAASAVRRMAAPNRQLLVADLTACATAEAVGAPWRSATSPRGPDRSPFVAPTQPATCLPALSCEYSVVRRSGRCWGHDRITRTCTIGSSSGSTHTAQQAHLPACVLHSRKCAVLSLDDDLPLSDARECIWGSTSEKCHGRHHARPHRRPPEPGVGR